MDTSQARDILQALADGIAPQAGKVLNGTSPCQHPQVVRALYTAIRQLESAVPLKVKTHKLPAKAGKAWMEDEEQTRGAVQSRLERHGLLELRRTPE